MLGDSVSPRVAAMTVPSVATHTVCSPLLAFLMIATGRSSRFTLCSPFTIPACASTVKRRLQGNSQTPSLLHAQIAKTQAWSSSAMQVIYCTWQRRSAHQDDQRVDALQRHPVDGACIMAAQHRIAAGKQLVRQRKACRPCSSPSAVAAVIEAACGPPLASRTERHADVTKALWRAPASSGAASADDTPGTSWKGVPAAASAAISPDTREKVDGHPPLSRTTLLPCSIGCECILFVVPHQDITCSPRTRASGAKYATAG